MNKKANKKEGVLKAFCEDLNDFELQERYDRFFENAKREKEHYNKLVPVVNDLFKRVHELQHIVLESAVLGILATECIEELKKARLELEETNSRANQHKEAMEYQEELIEKYKKSSDNKFFTWWKALRSVDSETPTWMHWIEEYKNRII
jgi:NADH dehydrogenase/NADH:ubiquinone oxidoreductase subunit G